MLRRLKAALNKRPTRAELLKAIEWTCGGDTGVSSKALMVFLSGVRVGQYGYPHDGGDFGRCIRMLRQVGWEHRFPEAAEMGPVWAALVAHYAEISALYDAFDYDADRWVSHPRDPRYERKNASAKRIAEYEKAKAEYDALPSTRYYARVREIVRSAGDD